MLYQVYLVKPESSFSLSLSRYIRKNNLLIVGTDIADVFTGAAEVKTVGVHPPYPDW